MNDRPGPYQRPCEARLLSGLEAMLIEDVGHLVRQHAGQFRLVVHFPQRGAGDHDVSVGAEAACAAALVNLLTGQQDDQEIPVLPMIDARLAAGETDGWRYSDMPEDGQAWRDTLAYLDADADTRCGTAFAAAPEEQQLELIQAVQDRGSKDWHGLNAAHVWSLWTRYACTALYAHPLAWNEIGFSGPAYPRGYKNAGVDKLEPFEVRDARPSGDPIREGA